MQFRGLKLLGLMTALTLSATAQTSFAHDTTSKSCHKNMCHTHRCKGKERCHKEISQFTTLLHRSGVCNGMKGKGPYTVFAPTNEAFDKLPKGTVDNWLAHRNQLNKVLRYHIVRGRHTAAEIGHYGSLKTLEGESLMTNSKDSTVIVDGAIITKPDIKCHGGYIQEIDTVLMPERGK